MTNTGMVMQGFRIDKTPSILKRLKRLYGTPTLQDLYQSLLRLHDPIYCNQPVDVILRTTKEVQLLLIAHPDEEGG